MLNVNQLTLQLARMPDPALQQYAQMHKNDPYTVSLALFESNRRKEMRASAQGQQGMVPQPKVVDQEIAAMEQPQGQAQAMPEDVGIGALAAPNMQGMADGGIVAFQDQGLVQDMSPDAINERYRQGELQKIKDLFGITGASRGYQSGFTPQEKQNRMQATAVPSPANPKPYEPFETGFTGSNVLTPPVLQAPPPRPNLTPNTKLARAAAPAPVTPPAAQTPQDYLAQLDAMRTKRGAVVDPYAADTRAINEKAEQGIKEGIASLKADQAADMALMRKGQEERITKREGELTKSKDTNTGMAFLEAGLAMMQARGPGLAAIAQGAGIGVKQYASGIKDIKAAQEKLDDARDRIEELRQNQTSMNKSAVRAEEKDLRKTVLDGQRDLLTGVKAATGVSDADFRTAVTSNIAVSEAAQGRALTASEGVLDRRSRERVASMPGPQQQMLTALGGKGGLEAGLTKMQEIQADKTGAAYAKLFTETVAEANKAGATPPTAVEFAASLRSLAAALNPAKVPPPVAATGASRL